MNILPEYLYIIFMNVYFRIMYFKKKFNIYRIDKNQIQIDSIKIIVINAPTN
jgi:hypothetical protein